MRYILHMIRMDQIEFGITNVPVTYLFVKDPFPPRLAQNALLHTFNRHISDGPEPGKLRSGPPCEMLWIRFGLGRSQLIPLC
jgi:hypothetical protein